MLAEGEFPVAGPASETALRCPTALPWSLEKPVLYTLSTELWSGETLLDRAETTIGFRKAEWRTDGFWLLYAFACGGLSITACLRTALPQSGKHPLMRVFLPYCAVFAVLTLLSPALTVLQGAAIILGIVLPLGCTLRRNDKKRCTV